MRLLNLHECRVNLFAPGGPAVCEAASSLAVTRKPDRLMTPETKGPDLPPAKIRGALLGIIAVALAMRLVHFVAIAGTAYPNIPRVSTELDMYATLEWAQSILAGD